MAVIVRSSMSVMSSSMHVMFQSVAVTLSSMAVMFLFMSVFMDSVSRVEIAQLYRLSLVDAHTVSTCQSNKQTVSLSSMAVIVQSVAVAGNRKYVPTMASGPTLFMAVILNSMMTAKLNSKRHLKTIQYLNLK